jgi:predicted transcriptional regulator
MANTPVRTIRVAEDVWAQVLDVAVSRETSSGEIVREAIVQYLEREGK